MAVHWCYKMSNHPKEHQFALRKARNKQYSPFVSHASSDGPNCEAKASPPSEVSGGLKRVSRAPRRSTSMLQSSPCTETTPGSPGISTPTKSPSTPARIVDGLSGSLAPPEKETRTVNDCCFQLANNLKASSRETVVFLDVMNRFGFGCAVFFARAFDWQLRFRPRSSGCSQPCKPESAWLKELQGYDR